MKTSVQKLFAVLFLVIAYITANAQAAPELVFRNPVLQSGTANAEGAVYRFSNVTTGVDAEITLKKFSRPDIVMQDIDLAGMGHDKAFQPQFGLPGTVAPYQNWSIDFQMNFYEAGTSIKKDLLQVVFTALDVDGDGWSINEYTQFDNASSKQYSTVTALIDSVSATPTFNNGGNSQEIFTCPICSVTGKIKKCGDCHGDGRIGNNECARCDGSGHCFKECDHAFAIFNQSKGPVQNFNSIDTGATEVMVTYSFQNKNQINFTYGASSGANASNGSGIRLNSLWAKSFSLLPVSTLPVRFTNITAVYASGNGIISWQTLDQEEANYFVVQRSTDGKTFNDIATVFGGTTTNYSYKDKSISSTSGVVYYRVVSIDKTNEARYSSIKMLRLNINETAALSLVTYPNPVVNDVHITMPATWQGKAVTLQLYNANGSIAKSLQLSSASQTETISVSNFAKGMYVIKATCASETAQQRVVKN